MVNAEDAVVAEKTDEGAFQVRIHTGEHTFLMDEPIDVGGLSSGPSPFDLLSAALSACTLMTMKLYAQRKGWKIDHLRVAVTHHKGAEGRDRFERILDIGDVTDEQREGLLRIAERCPVHLLLDHGADVSTKAAQVELQSGRSELLHGQMIDALCREAL
jgi:putative redox protein